MAKKRRTKTQFKRDMLAMLLNEFGGRALLPKRTVGALERKIAVLTEQAEAGHARATTAKAEPPAKPAPAKVPPPGLKPRRERHDI